MKLKPYIHVIVMALVLFGALSVYGVWYSRIGKESANAVSLEQQIRVKTETASKAEEAKSQLTKALSDRAAITGYFVNTNDVVPFLETLQATGAKYGSKVAVESVSSQPAEPHALLQLSVSITGSFDSVLRTLGAIEYEPYDTTVSNVTLDTPDGKEWTAALSMNVGTIDTPVSTAPVTATTSATASSTATTTP